MAVARALTVPGEPAVWEPLGFAPGAPLGGVALVFGAPALELVIEGLASEAPDGLPLRQADASPPTPPAGHGAHPNGALAIDHVVALTDDMDRTLAALEQAGLEVRRIRVPPEAHVRQAFIHLRSMILEVVEVEGDGPAMWGVTVSVADLDACVRELGPLLGTPRDAVQSGRRIATVRPEAGLPIALAFMTPRAP